MTCLRSTFEFHILILRYVKKSVPIDTVNRFLFLVSCEWISLLFCGKHLNQRFDHE